MYCICTMRYVMYCIYAHLEPQLILLFLGLTRKGCKLHIDLSLGSLEIKQTYVYYIQLSPSQDNAR